MIATLDLDEGLRQLDSLDATGVPLPRDARDKLVAYLDLLAKWNHTYNLTAIREPERMITHHVLDALAVLPHFPDETVLPGPRLLDVGSGAGLPAIPLAIARPSWRVVALDSSYKKGAFVQQAIIELALANVEAVIARVEDYTPAAPFDIVISRAFSDLETFVVAGSRHLAAGGQLLAMKGVYPDEEIAQLPPGYRVAASPTLTVPGLEAHRHLIVIERA